MPRTTAKKARRASESVIDKTIMAKAIARIIDEREMTQTETGYLTGEAPSQLSLIVNGKLNGISPERMLRILGKLGRDVEIRIGPSKGREGKVRVTIG